MNQSLVIKNLYSSIGDKSILKGVTLTVEPGQVHALMGPNGSGKSTLAYTLMGHPSYEITNDKLQMTNGKNQKSQVTIGDKNILELSPEERAKAGLFLAFQSPIGIPGVTVMNLLRTAYQEIYGGEQSSQGEKPIQNPVLAKRWKSTTVSIAQFMEQLKTCCALLKLSESFLQRSVHEEFSGGEKKKIEMLQAMIIRPKYAIFDEIDTGLDVDALRVVAKGIEFLKTHGTGVIIITHYQRILKYIEPDHVHIFVNGRIVATGPKTLAQEIEKNGYQKFLK